MNRLVPIAATTRLPMLIAAAGESASLRFPEFFAANIRNPHTRRAYSRAVSEFMAWCDDNGVTSITAVQPLHVSAWIEQQTREHAAPTAKLRLAALRHLFNWLVTGQVIPTNPAGSVRGPSHIVKAGKTPVLAPEEARALIDSIEITTPAGLRDRALIGLAAHWRRRRRRRTMPARARRSSTTGGVRNSVSMRWSGSGCDRRSI
jgi:integrase/recombinase XerC